MVVVMRGVHECVVACIGVYGRGTHVSRAADASVGRLAITSVRAAVRTAVGVAACVCGGTIARERVAATAIVIVTPVASSAALKGGSIEASEMRKRG